MFTLNLFEILLSEGRLLLRPAQRGTERERVKSGFDSDQGLPYESSSHIVYKVLYCHRYDHCIVNIVILYYVHTWKLSIT